MSRQAWLTPDSIPTATICRRLVIPDELGVKIAVSGALDLLGFAKNWEQFGSVTPDDMASAMRDMLWNFINEGTVCMIGAIVSFATATVPDGALECDGSTYLQADYPELYSVLDTAFIIDADSFFVPDLRGRVSVGIGTGSGLTARAMNDIFGEETHVLSTAELASHNHTQNPHTHTEITATASIAEVSVVPVPTAIPGVGVTGASTATNNATGSDTAHNNIQPSVALRMCIIAR